MSIRSTLVASTLLVVAGQAVANPPFDGAGAEGDAYYIPPGFFAPGVPAVGTLAQQAAMAAAVDQMWALGEAVRDDITALGDLALADLDAYIATGPEPWDLYDFAVDLERVMDEAGADGQEEIASNVVPIFGPIEDSLPAPPTELLTAAFGPTLTSIGVVLAEADYYILEIASRRPMERPIDPTAPVAPPAPPAPLMVAPAVAQDAQSSASAAPSVTQPDPSPPQQSGSQSPSVPSLAEQAAGGDAQAQAPAPRLAPQDQKRLERLEKRADRERAKLERLETSNASKESRQEDKIEAMQSRADSKIAQERAKLASMDPSDRRYQRQQSKLVRLEERFERQLAKQRSRLEQMREQHEDKLDVQRLRLEQLTVQQSAIRSGRSFG